jgi:hypothetical protein
MCCLFTILVLLGARAVDIVWWIAQPARWDMAFSSWLWPVLGIIFLPWTTMFYVIVAPGGVNGIDWLWVALGVVIDIVFYSGGAWKNRDRAGYPA